MTDRRKDPITDEMERVRRELCEMLELDPDWLVEGEPLWRHAARIESAESAITSWRRLAALSERRIGMRAPL